MRTHTPVESTEPNPTLAEMADRAERIVVDRLARLEENDDDASIRDLNVLLAAILKLADIRRRLTEPTSNDDNIKSAWDDRDERELLRILEFAFRRHTRELDEGAGQV